MSTFMLLACALILAQVLALSVLVSDAIRRERAGLPAPLRRRLARGPAAAPRIERRRAPRGPATLAGSLTA